MRKIIRNTVAAPTCLSKYSRQHASWDKSDTGDIRKALQQLQKHCCAYCESSLSDDKGNVHAHIEHFRSRHKFPKLTFEWTNLFLSCKSSSHCGHHKDNAKTPQYNSDDLIKPDEEDPHDYLFFDSQGMVLPRRGIEDAKKKKADETIRVFNLNHDKLCVARKNAVKRYHDDLKELMSWPPAERESYIRDEIDLTQGDPYSAAIRDFFEKTI